MRHWIGFILCLLLSGAFWFVNVLSKETTDFVSTSILVSSNLENRAHWASGETVITAKCEATGFRLLSIQLRRKPAHVFIDASDIYCKDGDLYAITAQNLESYVPNIFGSPVNVISFADNEYSFRFDVEKSRKVPVSVNQMTTFRPQYMALKDMMVFPDSVYIYGDERVMSHIDMIHTKQIMLSDLRSNVHGVIGLEVPYGIRVSAQEVEYSLEVTRFVEIHSTVKIGTRNVPDDVHFIVLPSTAEVLFNCVFPVESDPGAEADFYVDYDEFSRSRSGKCLVHCGNSPKGVIQYRINPEVCDCIEQ